MKQIALTGSKGNGLFVLVDNEDYGRLNQYKWCTHHSRKGIYAVRQIGTNRNSKIQSMHRLLMGNPKGKVVDHINRYTLDNQKRNLRVITNLENLLNSEKRKGEYLSSKFKGVHRGKLRNGTLRNKWSASVHYNHQVFGIHGFNSEHHAALARDLWAIDIHGPTTFTNFTVVSFGNGEVESAS